MVAYSLLCTHAGCPVALYEQGTGRMLCPCHQSAFDLLAGAEPIAGPAGRPLPGLPIAVDTDGYLVARGDFTAPPGPGFWSRAMIIKRLVPARWTPGCGFAPIGPQGRWRKVFPDHWSFMLGEIALYCVRGRSC